MVGYLHPHTQLKTSEIPHTHTQLKNSEIPHTHTHTHIQSMWGFFVKTETGSGNIHEGGFNCHL